MSAARTARQVFALAGGTLREAIRMKAFAVPAVFAATALALSPFLPSDGTPSGAVRLAISMSLLTATIFGTFAAVMLAALLPAHEKRDSTDFLVATKPVPRWGLFAGRALGLSCVLTVMFVGMATLSWIFVRYTAAREGAGGDDARAEVTEALAVRVETPAAWETGPVRVPNAGPRGPVDLPPGAKLRWRFMLPPSVQHLERFEGRVELAPGASSWPEGLVVRAILPDGEAGAVEWLDSESPGQESLAPRSMRRFALTREQVRFEDEHPNHPGEAVVEIENGGPEVVGLGGPVPVVLLIGANANVSPGATYEWRFRLPKGSADPAFRFRGARAMQFIQEIEIEIRGSGVAGPVTRRIVLGPGGSVLIRVPADFVPDDGLVTAELRNTSMDGVRMPVRGGLVFAPRGGTFAGALARWAVVEIAKVVFLILLISAGAMALSFPIPALLGGAAAVGGYLISFVMALTTSGAHSAWTAVFEGALCALLPDLAGATVAGSVAGGDLVSAWFVLKAAFLLVVVRGGLLAVLGGWLAARREVAA